MRFSNIKHLTIGFVVGSLFFSGISYAANTVKLEAKYGIKLIHNNIDKTPTDANSKPFVVNGTTYVPLRTVSNLLNTEVTYDSSKNAVVIGNKVEGTPLPLPSKFTSSSSNDTYEKDYKMKIDGKAYGSKGFTIISSRKYGSSDSIIMNFPLNSKYKTLHLGIGSQDLVYSSGSLKDTEYPSGLRTVIIKDQDNNELYTVSLGRKTIEENISIDVRGVTTLVFEIPPAYDSDAWINLINPILIK